MRLRLTLRHNTEIVIRTWRSVPGTTGSHHTGAITVVVGGIVGGDEEVGHTGNEASMVETHVVTELVDDDTTSIVVLAGLWIVRITHDGPVVVTITNGNSTTNDTETSPIEVTITNEDTRTVGLVDSGIDLLAVLDGGVHQVTVAGALVDLRGDGTAGRSDVGSLIIHRDSVVRHETEPVVDHVEVLGGGGHSDAGVLTPTLATNHSNLQLGVVVGTTVHWGGIVHQFGGPPWVGCETGVAGEVHVVASNVVADSGVTILEREVVGVLDGVDESVAIEVPEDLLNFRRLSMIDVCVKIGDDFHRENTNNDKEQG